MDVDDASVFIARFENGALGTFEATRFAGGNKNGKRFEINGEKASIRWDLENMNTLEVYFADDEPGLQGYRLINCTEEHHPMPELIGLQRILSDMSIRLSTWCMS